MEAVAQCMECGSPVPPEDVERVQKKEDLRFLIYQHGQCGGTGQTIKREVEYKRFLARWQNYKMQGQTEITKIYDPEEVGILVAGFRKVDLPSIETVEDLIEEWKTSDPPIERKSGGVFQDR